MKTILHPDYWAEIPAGDYLTGLSPAQEAYIAARMREQFGVDYYPYWRENLRRDPPRLTLEPKVVRLERFYISRFPITTVQAVYFSNGQAADSLPGAMEGPAMVEIDLAGLKYDAHTTDSATNKPAEKLCAELGARLPSGLEWEAAARGREGRLYPWGDEWDPEAGYFFHRDGVSESGAGVVNAYPRGATPEGVYQLLGWLPQMVGSFSQRSEKGCHPKATTPERAWMDNIVPLAHKGAGYVALRPVLDQWPKKQWTGAGTL